MLPEITRTACTTYSVAVWMSVSAKLGRRTVHTSKPRSGRIF
jgi:hypothetical protein